MGYQLGCHQHLLEIPCSSLVILKNTPHPLMRLKMQPVLLPSASFTGHSEAKDNFSKADIHGNTAPSNIQGMMKGSEGEGLLLWSSWDSFLLPHDSSGHCLGAALPIGSLLCHIIEPRIHLAEGLRNYFCACFARLCYLCTWLLVSSFLMACVLGAPESACPLSSDRRC